MAATTASEFYGKTYASCGKQSKLDDAFKWLTKACAFDASGDQMKTSMALKAALKAEAEALGHEADLTNLAA